MNDYHEERMKELQKEIHHQQEEAANFEKLNQTEHEQRFTDIKEIGKELIESERKFHEQEKQQKLNVKKLYEKKLAVQQKLNEQKRTFMTEKFKYVMGQRRW